MRKRYTIALFIDSTRSSYQATLLHAAAEAAREMDCHFVARVGHFNFIPPSTSVIDRDSVYYLNRAHIDGVVFVSNDLERRHPGLNTSILEKLRAIPVVTIHPQSPEFPSLTIDNYQGMYDMVSHLIEVHKKKSIAFISGPLSMSDAVERLKGYEQALRDHGHPVNRDLIVEGTFWVPSGKKGVKTLLDERKVEFDALAAGNDYMAIGAMEEFKQRGIRVPEDVALTGFDNIEENFYFSSGMSTVNQPVYAMGFRAVQLLLDMLEGREVPEKTFVPTLPLYRGTCGCAGCSIYSGHSQDLVEKAGEIIRYWCALYYPGILEGHHQRWADSLAEALARGIKEFSTWDFLFNLELVLTESVNLSLDLGIWLDVVRCLLDGIGLMFSDKKILDFLFSLYRESEGMIRKQIYEKRWTLSSLRNVMEEMNFVRPFSGFDIPNLQEGLIKVIRDNGVKNFYLVLIAGEKKAKCLLSYDNGYADKTLKPFPLKEIVPRGMSRFKDRYSFIMMPIYFDSDFKGYFLTDLFNISFEYLDLLSGLLGSLLMGIELLLQVKDYSSGLAGVIEKKARELAGVQDELIKAAKGAGKAEIIMDILHNTGNTINPVNVAIDRMLETIEFSSPSRLKKANTLLEQLETPGSDISRRKELILYYKELYKTMEEERLGFREELIRAKMVLTDVVSIIRSQEQNLYACDITEEVDFNRMIDTLLGIMEGDFRQNKIAVIRNYKNKETIILFTKETKLLHILMNLIKNSIEALEECQGKRFIIFDIRKSPDKVELIIRDSGPGIGPEYISSIFQQGFTTKIGHQGLGLHNSSLYIRELAGELKMESPGPGKGCEARVILPLPGGKDV